MSSSSAKSITKPLYRSILRAIKPFVSSDNGPILCSLIHRNGLDDNIDYSKIRFPLSETNSALTSTRRLEGSDDEISEIEKTYLTKDQAMDLSRGYDELRRLQYHREKIRQRESPQSTATDLHGTDISDDRYESIMMEKLLLSGNNMGELPPAHTILFKQLMRDITGASRLMDFPSQIRAQTDGNNCMDRLLKVVRREFRSSQDNDDNDKVAGGERVVSAKFADLVRRQAAFLALRELNKKLLWAQSLGLNTSFPTKETNSHIKTRNHNQKARGVSLLPTNNPASYLRPGSYLVAHPLLSGYFSRSVIAILDHNDTYLEREKRERKSGGTYGLVVNRESIVGPSDSNNAHLNHNRTLCEVVRPNCLPSSLTDAFGDNTIREGGPVNLSLQMTYSASSEKEDKLNIGGTLIPMILTDEQNIEENAAIDNNNAIYYQGDIIKAAQSVFDEEMDPDDFSFLIGASCWEIGQLENEIARGYWLPCKGPPQIAHTGMCEHVDQNNDESDHVVGTKIENMKNNSSRPKSDLWLSMMCALGEDEANFAHLLFDDRHDDNGNPCDDV